MTDGVSGQIPSPMRRGLRRRSVLAGLGGLVSTAAISPLVPTCAAHAASVPSQLGGGKEETVPYAGFTGFSSVTYSSRFFGPDNAMNRDFTYYGTSFEKTHSQAVDVSIPAGAFASGRAAMLLGRVYGSDFDDLVFYDAATGRLFLLRGNGDGSFASEPDVVSLPRRGGSAVVGDLRGTGRADIGLYDEHDGSLSWFLGDGKGHFGSGPAGRIQAGVTQLLAIDLTGDGLSDIVTYDPSSGRITALRGDGHGRFRALRESTWPGAPSGGHLIGADFDEDHFGDLALYRGSAFPDGMSFRMGNGDGTFGPLPEEVGTLLENHAACDYAVAETAPVAAAGQVDGDGAADLVLYDPTSGMLTTRLVFDGRPDYHFATQPAYDYSVDLIKDRGIYKMWSGGRWQSIDYDPHSQQVTSLGDGDHILYSYSPDGRRWFRRRGPVLFNGSELGETGWWTANALEPEVVIVDGHYYMYWQVEIDAGKQVDTGETATSQADRIGVSHSADGVHWTRKTDRSVVVNIDRPAETMLDHEEVIYVPDDPDGLPYWMYVFHFIAGAAQGHVRIRSADPMTYDWRARERVAGLSQIGNQIGYADNAPGGRVFVRITFTADPTGRQVPTIELSRDGLSWIQQPGAPQLAGSTDNDLNPNCYFLGLSTVEHGRLEQIGPRTYRAIYGATTAQAPGGLPIFYSEIGTGELTLTFDA